MPNAAPAITRMNAGKLSKLMGARIDQSVRPYYDAGAQVLDNYFATVEGPMTKRSGFEYIKPAHAGADYRKLIPFYYNASNRYIIEMSEGGPSFEGGIRFIKNGTPLMSSSSTMTVAPTAANPVVIDYPSHGLSGSEGEVYITGSAMEEINNRYFQVSGATSNTLNLVGEDGTGRVTGTGGTASILEKMSPFGSNNPDVSEAQYAQKGAEMFIAHEDWFIGILTLDPDTDTWAKSGVGSAAGWPLFEFDDVSGVSIQASATTGLGITLTASSAIFTDDILFRNIRLTDPASGIGPVSAGGGEGYAVIRSVGSSPSTTATVDVVQDFDPQVVSAATTRWAWGVSANPRVLAFFDDRLWLSGIDGYPGEIWSSQIGSYGNFYRGTADDDALHFRIQHGNNEEIQYMTGLDEVLIVGTSSGEHTVTSLDPSTAVAAGNVKARRRTDHGARRLVQPAVVDDRVLFVHRSGYRLRDFRYRVETNEATSFDLTRLSRDIARGQIVQIAFQDEPNQIVWARQEDGSLIALTQDYQELVTAWQNVSVGGSPTVLQVVALPSETSPSDELWTITRRTINGGTVEYIEKLAPFWESSFAVEDAIFLDCARSYSGSPASSFTSAHHLEGETVSVLADGVRHNDVTITNGGFTISNPASKVTIGYPYNAEYLSMPIEGGSADGTSQGKLGSVSRIMLRLYQTGEGLSYGTSLDASDLRPVPIRRVSDDMDSPAPLFDGDKNNLMMPSNQTERREIALKHSEPLPCTIVGIFPRLNAR